MKYLNLNFFNISKRVGIFVALEFVVTVPILCLSTAFAADGLSFLEEVFQKQGFPADIRTIANADGTSPEMPFSVVSAVAIPDGRSLQAAAASCKDPRLVFAVKPAANNSSPPSFIGHINDTGGSELISWNATARRYEFLLVTRSEKGVSTISRPNRGICITCHQNEGPIFSRSPWAETSVMPQVQRLIQNCQATLPPERRIEFSTFNFQEENHNSGRGIPILNDASLFDGQVRASARALQAGQICNSLCGDDITCRGALLAQAINFAPSFKDAPIFSLPRNDAIDPLLKYWPQQGFRYPSTVLPDRNPLDHPEKQGTSVVFLDPKDPRIFFPPSATNENPTYSENQTDENIPLLQGGVADQLRLRQGLTNSENPRVVPNAEVEFKYLFGVRLLADPRTKRPLTTAVTSEMINEMSSPQAPHSQSYPTFTALASACFGMSESDIKTLASDRRGSILRALYAPEVHRLLAQWPPDKVSLMRVLNDRTLTPRDRDLPKGPIAPQIKLNPASGGAEPTSVSLRQNEPPKLQGPTDSLADISCALARTLESLPLAIQGMRLIELGRAIENASGLPPVDRERALNNFSHYCSGCHSEANWDYSGAVLPLGSLKDLAIYAPPGKVRSYLRPHRMPPQKEKQPTEIERTEMIRALEYFNAEENRR